MDELIGSHIESQGVKKMSPEEIKKSADLYSKYLSESINEVSHEYKVNLFVDPALVTTASDYTKIVKERINAKISNTN